MTDIKLTTQHDLLIENGDIGLFSAEEELTAQTVKINLQNYKGEWFPDISTGIPYLQRILNKKDTEAITHILLREAITDSYNIKAITKYAYSYHERKLQITFSASLNSGGSIADLTLEINK